MKKLFFVLCLISFPTASLSTTAPNLENRIQIDGNAAEYSPDEWILNAATAVTESDDDSRWGVKNDIRGVAVTWDRSFLYIAVTCATNDSELMIFIEHANGGVKDLRAAAHLRRSVVFTGLSPNLIVSANRAVPEAAVASVSSADPFELLENAGFDSYFFQPPEGGGALEIALPWAVVQPTSGQIKILSIITGSEGTGAGDAAPDPSSPLPGTPTERAYLDNAVTLVVDGNGDGLPDVGISPRDAASFGAGSDAPAQESHEFEIQLNTKIIAPDQGQSLEIKIGPGETRSQIQLFLTCEVFSIDGRRVTTLFRDQPRLLVPNLAPQVDVWDGRDAGGEIVPGGVYVINVTGGAARGAITHAVRKSVAVAR